MASITLEAGLITSILAIVFGILVIKYPKLIGWLVGIYLIIIGALGLVTYFL